MRRTIVTLTGVLIFVSALTCAGLVQVESRSTSPSQSAKQPLFDTTYRSATRHKVVVPSEHKELREQILSDGGSVIEEYGAFALLSTPEKSGHAASSLPPGATVRDDMNVLMLRAGAFDTTAGETQFESALENPMSGDHGLYLVQMVGPVKSEWLDELERSSQILDYIPNNAYLVRADATGLGRIASLSAERGGFIQWYGSFKPAYKLAPELPLDGDQEIFATVQLVRTDHNESDILNVASLSSQPLIGEPVQVLKYTNIRIKARPDALAELARMNEVVWIEPWQPAQMFDERQALIIAGNLVTLQSARPGYMTWLQSKGLNASPDFLIDVADSGIDKGSLDPAVLHKDFLNSAGLSRILYARFVGQDDQQTKFNDIGGHGTLNAGIIAGYNTTTYFPFVDSEGYSYGLGVHPLAKLGVSRVFTPEWTNPTFTTLVDMMYRDGARISTNSWGSYSNAYGTDCQTYDSLVRDARSSVSGNQEMVIVFASGNGGANKLSSPSSAKNVIAVGASEGLRPGTDGCGIGSDGADDIYSIINFSSGGLTADGRTKPDLVGPGTHIEGALSQDPDNSGSGVCGPKASPSGQSFYTWSSGTSHSAPAIAGAAGLIRQFFQQGTGRAPSPAMIKAFLTNTTTYMTGDLASGDVPNLRQGWGLVNLGRALDTTPRLTLDQTQTLSGTGQSILIRGRVADSTKPYRVTLAWTDAPGSPSANPVVNDLNLQVEIGGKTYLGNHFAANLSVEGGSADSRNNVEAVWLPAGTTGDFVVKVVAANVAGDGVPGNADTTDQDFALVIYNALGEGAGPLDAPPIVNLRYPAGGERLMPANLVKITWDASDDKGIQSQKLEFSADGGSTYNTLALLNATQRSFDWRIPPVPTNNGKIRITALDGVNLPVSSFNGQDFTIINGPPDTVPPSVILTAPNGDSILGGGLTTTIKWRESDNVGVIQRVIDFSTDGGLTFQTIGSIVAPSSGDQQQFNWDIPAAMDISKGKMRITVYDGAGNSAQVLSSGKFEVWPLPIITGADFITIDGKPALDVFGRAFRENDTDILVDGVALRKLRFYKCGDGDGVCKEVASVDKKINKRVPEGQFVNIQVLIRTTGQMSPVFEWKRKRPKQ